MSNGQDDDIDQTSHLQRDDEEDLIVAALDFLAASATRDGQPSWKSAPSWQEARLREWAENLGILLDPEEYASRVVRGGQEHDVIIEADRYIKITRHGVFGLTPGIDLALVAEGEDARRFHLWEATPAQYLDRLFLQNQLTPGLNILMGVLPQPNEISLVISQPRFDLNQVSQSEINEWFLKQGFEIITSAAFYREEDNLGIFDAHDKNVVRATVDPNILIPFDVIPVHPNEGFLTFIRDVLLSGHGLSVEKTTNTSSISS